MTRKKRKIKNPIYFEYNIPFIDIEEILRQIVYYAYQNGNFVRDYIIGANYTYDSENNRFYTYKVFLSLSKSMDEDISDFNIILERIFIYRPIYKVLELKNEKQIFVDIANFAIGRPPTEDNFFTVPLNTKLVFSSRIKKYFYRHWKYYKYYKGMLTRVEFRNDDRILYFNVIKLTNQGLISEALELIRIESPFEYIRGAEDYESKLQAIQLQMLGFRRKYDFSNYRIPQKYQYILDDIKTWKLEVKTPKVLVLYGRFNCSKTKVILNLIGSFLGIEILNIFSLKDTKFLEKSVALLINDIDISLSKIDSVTQIGIINRKKVGEILVQIIIDSIKLNSPDFHLYDDRISDIILDNLIIYDMDNNFMFYLGNMVQSKLLVDYFSLKKRRSILNIDFFTKLNFFRKFS